MKTSKNISSPLKKTNAESIFLVSEYKKEIRRLQKKNAKLEVRHQSDQAKIKLLESDKPIVNVHFHTSRKPIPNPVHEGVATAQPHN